MALRALHVLSGGTLLGGHIFGLHRDSLLPWLVATLASGTTLLLVDMLASFAVLCEVRGTMVFVKLALVGLAGIYWPARVPLLVTALLLGVFASHMSGRQRHFVLFLRGHVVPNRRKG
ncbi:MAG: hypothetical protein A2289_00850 [Deltaproteobacteria bacterium RIFOXYA12_FULL_58_15]|nr:MAG: hypothetical protein A2289_00850 [Deltaproteobacteria bacterium RIFOXYA12_FULL_58_15]OGR11256.1 MAG: hypothetical protein A2341_17605 [Deltaproteobacteria bacterium RIFOXYB12_FULL_58_9]